MKKLLLTALVAGLGLSASVSAAELPYASIFSGITGKYTCSAWGMPNIDVQYIVDGEPLTIDFVNVKTRYESWDIDHEYPVYYTNLTLLNSKGEETTVTAGIYDPNDIGVLSLDTRASNHSGTTVTVQLSDLAKYEWAEEEYTIIIPENTFADLDGNSNPAQEIKWTNLTYYVTCPLSSITPSPEAGSNTGIYTSEKLKAVTLHFEDKVEYNTGNITYDNSQKTVPAEKIKFEGNDLILDLSFLEEGSYYFEIPMGFITVGNGLYSSQRIHFIVWNGLPVGEMLSGPALKDDYPTNVELYFGPDIQAVGGQFAPLGVYKYEVAGEPVFEIPSENISIKEVAYPAGGDEMVPVLYLDIEDLFDNFGPTYIIYIPEGYLENSKHEINRAQEVTFTLIPLAEYPAITMSDNIIYMRWDASSGFNNNPVMGSPYVILPDQSIKYLSYSYNSFDKSDITDIKSGVKGVQADLNKIIETNGAGNYELVVPKAYFQMKIEGVLHINPEIKYPFEIEGEDSGLMEFTVSGTHTVYGENGSVLSENDDFFIMTLNPFEDYLLDAFTFAGYDVPAPDGYQTCYFVDVFGEGEYLMDSESQGNLLTTINADMEAVVVASAGEEFSYMPWVTMKLPTETENGTLSDFTVWVFNFDEWEPVALLDAWSNLTITKGASSAVDTIKPAVKGEDVIFNLNGVRVDRNKMTNGIYIINGKKVVVRK